MQQQTFRNEPESLYDSADHCLAWRHAVVEWQTFLPQEKKKKTLLREVSKHLPDRMSSLRNVSKYLSDYTESRPKNSWIFIVAHVRACSSSVLKTEATGSSETLVNTHHYTERHVPEDSNLHCHRLEDGGSRFSEALVNKYRTKWHHIR